MLEGKVICYLPRLMRGSRVLIRLLACSVVVASVARPTVDAAQPVRVVSTEFALNPRQPQAAVDAAGTIYITFGAGGAVYCCKSTDAGKSYAAPVKIGEVPRLALGMRRGPRIAVHGDALVVTAISHDSGNLMAWHSTHGGESWEGPVNVNDSAGSAREGLHAMAIGPDGGLFCTWLDLRNKGTQIYGASSSDGGQTWSANRQIYRSPSGAVCECCHPSVAIDSQGAVYVMWRNSVAGNRDLYAAVSSDGGKTFKTAVKLGMGTWKLGSCPMDGGTLASTAPGKLVAVWRRENQLYKLSSGDRSETPLAVGEQPWLTNSSDGVWLTWISKRDGELWLSAPKAKQPVKLHDRATDPVLASSITGQGPVVAVWETGRNRDTGIMAAVVSQ